MAHGLPDYGINVAKAITFNLADMADLAVRMGSIVEYDRRGDVIYIDDCEAPAPRFKDASTGVCSAKLDTETAYSAIQSIKLLLDGDTTKSARAYYFVAPLVSGRHGVKIAACLYRLNARRQPFDIWFSTYTGTHEATAGVQIIPHAKTIAYYDPDGNPIVFEDNFILVDALVQEFHNIKLVIDFDTGKYVRLLFDSLSWDLSSYSFSKVLNPHAPLNEVQFHLTCDTAFVDYMWLDNFVYTINEP